jgi:prepilin-type N-terminal cleavage/methylation domain-containing protein
MKNAALLLNRKGFSLMEVLLAMIILAVIGISLSNMLGSSWRMVTFSKKTLIAGHLIERETERMRMLIDRNAAKYFPPVDSQCTVDGINLQWKISTAVRPTDGANLSNTCKCSFIASWGNGKNDTLKVTTYLSKMF